MKENIKSIIPGEGLGEIKFGMLQDDVKNIIGLPNEIQIYQYIPNNPKERSEDWHYRDLELSISFSCEEDWKLDRIEVSSNYHLLWNKIQISQPIQQVKEILKTLDKEYEFEDWSSPGVLDHKLFELDKHLLNLWFDEGQLSEIQWIPLFFNEEEINWPFESELKNSFADFGYKRYSTDLLFDKLKTHASSFLDEIFKNENKYSELLQDFPANTHRENLSTENYEIIYHINTIDKIKGGGVLQQKLIYFTMKLVK